MKHDGPLSCEISGSHGSKYEDDSLCPLPHSQLTVNGHYPESHKSAAHSTRSIYLKYLPYFMSIGWDDVSELRPPMGLLYIHQMIYEYGQPQWKGTDQVNPKKLREEPIIVPLFPPKCHMDRPGQEPGPSLREAGAYSPDPWHVL
jgi:hypothetical protein